MEKELQNVRGTTCRCMQTRAYVETATGYDRMITSFCKNRWEFSSVKVRFQKNGEILLFVQATCSFDYSAHVLRIFHETCLFSMINLSC